MEYSWCPDDQSVTVVIPTRDRPQLLRKAIAAVVAQDHVDDIEILVVFDQSNPDHSLPEEFSADDGSVQLAVTTNNRSLGLAGARNTGIVAASNTWVAFCDDDDEWLPGKLRAQFAALRAAPEAGAACTGILICYDSTETLRVPVPESLTFDGFLRDRMTEVHPSSWLVHKGTLIDEIGLVDEQIPGGYAEDYDFFLRTAQVCSIAVASEPLVRVRWHGASFFFERWETIDRALAYLVEKYPEFESQPRGLARIRGQQAVAQAAMRRRGEALRTMAKTARLNPIEKRLPVAAAVLGGVPAEIVLKLAHRFGRGI
ncbi:MAG: glycosyltransferase family 2 protein [Actinomycetia bacterium]|nr:glycosyltransferase family 2 protein [Actinomycetes bacterium]MCP5032808.1 glycosyltransferase family 2 protein [Actinomycetes bacterium]